MSRNAEAATLRQPADPSPADRHVHLLGWGLFAVLVLIALVRSGFMLGPLYGDETHFFPSTVGLIPFRPVKLYAFREISSPTFFIAFSYVLQVLGRRVFWCRLIVLGCLVGCAFAFRAAGRRAADSAGTPRVFVGVGWALLLAFPYFVGCGVYYYTDVPALLFGLLAVGACEKGRTGRAAAWAALALHCRQYFVFIAAGAAAHEALTWWQTRDRAALKRMAIWTLPVLTYLPYVALWGGASSMEAIDPRQAALPLVRPWHVTYMFAACGLYMLPAALAVAASRWNWRKAAFMALAVAAFLVFPPRPNLYYRLIESPIETLGLADSGLRALLGQTGALAVLAVGMAVGAALHYELLFRGGPSGRPLALMIAAYWGMNLFSHLAWDKYLLPVMPLLYLAALRQPSLKTSAARATRTSPLLRTA